MSLAASPSFDLDKLETGKPSTFISNGLHLPRMDMHNEKSDHDSSISEETGRCCLHDLPTRAKTPIYGDSLNTYSLFLQQD